jgi:hypothetical protein
MNDNLNNTNALRTLESEHPGHDALDLDILSAPFNPSADKLKNGDNDSGNDGIDNNTSPHPAKRQRPASPHCQPNLHYNRTLQLPQNDDAESSIKYTDGSDTKSGDEILWSKRRKLSSSLGSRTTPGSHNGWSLHSAPSSSEDPKNDGGDGSEAISIDNNLVSTTGTTLDVFESASLTQPQSCPEATDTNRDWKIRKIIGKEYVHGVLHYLVEWCPTLEPAHSLEHMKELVDEFEARLIAMRMDKERRKEPAVKRDGQSMGAHASGGQQKKRGRGRPRKQK